MKTTKRIRSTSRYARTRRAYLATAKRQGLPCARCGQPIDYDMPWTPGRPHPGYPTINHRTPLARGGDPLDHTNLEPMHYACNSGLRDRIPHTPPSRNW